MNAIHTLVPHQGFHLDEVVLAAIIIYYGSGKIQIPRGIAIIPENLHCTEAEALSQGKLPLGQGHGVFDDKNEDGSRIPNTCSAIRGAEFVNAADREELQKLLRATLRVDTTATDSSTSIAKLIKDAVAGYPVSMQPGIFQWALKGCEAIIGYLNISYMYKSDGRTVECSDYVRPTAVFESLIAGGYIASLDTICFIWSKLQSSEKQVENCLEVSFIARAMKVTGISDKDTADWLMLGLFKWADMQMRREEAIKEIALRGVPYKIAPRYEGESLTALFIQTDNPQASKASRSPRMRFDLCAVRHPLTGNVAIMPNAKSDLDMRGIAALIRLMETPFEQRKFARFEDYIHEGNHPSAPNWYLMPGGALLNGTLNIPAIPTGLTEKQFMECVQVGLIYEARYRFNDMVREAGGDPVDVMVWPVPFEAPNHRVGGSESNHESRNLRALSPEALGLEESFRFN